MRAPVMIAVLLFGLLVTLKASAMQFDLPVVYQGRNLGELAVVLKGQQVSAISATGIHQVFGEYLAPELSHWLTDNSQAFFPLEQLAMKGITFELNPQSLELNAHIAEHAQGELAMSLSNDYELFIGTESTNYAWLNSFNLDHTYRHKDKADSHNTNLDWLSQLNIGGYKGLNISMANYFEQGDEDVSHFQRGEWIAYYERPNVPWRGSLGDVEPYLIGHLPALNMGGILIETNYNHLQPTRSISPTSSQLLILKETAEVDVYINGVRISSARLNAGRYNLTDLPLVSGANDIEVIATYLSGETEVFHFSQFYNSRLLRAGLLDYSFAVGALSEFDKQGIEYSEQWVSSGFVEYGFTPVLTLGVNGLVSEDGFLLGSTATLGTFLGNLGLRATYSDDIDHQQGTILSLDYEQRVWGGQESGAPNLRISAESLTDFNNTPWQQSEALTGTRYLFDYTLVFNRRWDMNFSGSWQDDEIEVPQKLAATTLYWNDFGFRIGLGGEYEENERYRDGDTRLVVTLDWNWYSSGADYRIRTNYNSRTEIGRIEAARENQNFVGNYGYEVSIEQGDKFDRENARASYTANRFRGETEFTRIALDKSNDEYRASIRATTSFALADGHLGWGRVPEGPFVLVDVHSTLNSCDVLINPTRDGEAGALATTMMAGLLPLNTAYTEHRINIDVPTAPIGYDWGDGGYKVAPGSTTAHMITIGSDNAFTVLGSLNGKDGKALGYVKGVVMNANQQAQFFTNKRGRFVIQGLPPGEYRIEMENPDYGVAILRIPDSGESIIRIEPITLK